MKGLFSNPKTSMSGAGILIGVLLKIYGPKIGLDLDPETFNNLIYALAGGGFMVGSDGD